MTKKQVVYVGATFGRLTAQERVGTRVSATGKTSVTDWKCVCECGKTAVVSNANLTKGVTKSCGCLHREQLVRRNTKHGLAHTPMYKVWLMITQRCNNPKNRGWGDYGGRGITIDPSWSSYEKFHADMAGTYEPGLTIERTDNDGPYCKSNCTWETRHTQNRNKRNNTWFVIDGVQMCVEDAASVLSVCSSAIRYWRRKQATDEEIVARFGGSQRPAGTSLPMLRKPKLHTTS